MGVRSDFRLESDRALLVGQLLAGQEATGLTLRDAAGDPSFSILPPVDQPALRVSVYDPADLRSRLCDGRSAGERTADAQRGRRRPRRHGGSEP